MKIEEIEVGNDYWCCDHPSGGVSVKWRIVAAIPPGDAHGFPEGGVVARKGWGIFSWAGAIPVRNVMAKVVT